MVLPIVLGFLAVALMVWDYQNERMVESMGMAWDTGPPVWPYRAVPLFLFSVNAPVYILAAPFFSLLRLETVPARSPVLLPLIVLWWWWIGTRIDFGVLGRRRYRHAKITARALLGVAVALLYVGIRVVFNEMHWWREYFQGFPPLRTILLRGTLPEVLWCLLLAGGALAAAIRLIQERFPPLAEKRAKHPMFAVGATMIAVLYICAVAAFNRAPAVTVDRNSCVIDRLYRLGCVHGTVVDENDRPVDRIEVNLMPAHKTGDARWYGTKNEWTDEHGRYNFNRAEPGEYFLAVNEYGAPDADRPFATAYYPGVEDESRANRVKVKHSFPSNLAPLRLHRLEIVTISVNIVWPDGTRPERSNLSFHNLSYPRQAVIGNVAPQVDDGKGQFTLPNGFEYEAVASVDCDAGKIIESRESKPAQRIKVAGSTTPAEMTFVLPGPPCPLWVSR